MGTIDGADPRIAAPVQTANPVNSGGGRVDLSAGVNWVGQQGVLGGQRFAAELSAPVHQDVNGVQMESDWTLTPGWQYALGGR